MSVHDFFVILSALRDGIIMFLKVNENVSISLCITLQW